uniref:Uncharacterized protein n=1 Tax=Chrysotila carterae TaxID=13221 RepID=A0A7S4F665_CHRCT
MSHAARDTRHVAHDTHVARDTWYLAFARASPRPSSHAQCCSRCMCWWRHSPLPRRAGRMRARVPVPFAQAVELDIPNGMPIAFNPKDGTLRAVGPLADSWPRKAEST